MVSITDSLGRFVDIGNKMRFVTVDKLAALLCREQTISDRWSGSCLKFRVKLTCLSRTVEANDLVVVADC